ncbi:MAG: LL-diaminopimelate aminotransferase [Candidatus Magnetominusculus sp. LBB02]|nr:LL-diaminopimelate aminotransferase [Candidatus Magnetominusculus sp. LBB02]
MRKTIELAERVKHLPPYLFDKIDKLKKQARSKGVDLIDLSIGDPDIPTPAHIVEALRAAASKPEHHRYPSYEGMAAYREAVTGWYFRRFGVRLDPVTEALSLIGSKEGIGHLPLAFVNQGDVVLCPSPGYPVYAVGTMFAGGEAYLMPLLESNGYFPDFSAIPEDILRRTKLMFLNYPNNPTSALCSKEQFIEAIELANKYNFIICHDAAYTEVYFNGKRPMSFLELDGAKDVGVEFHSLSKTYNMTGWRIGFAVGNADVIFGLGKIKTNLDSGVFQAVQEAAVTALNTDDAILAPLRETYRLRRDALYDGLKSIGIEAVKPEATFYLWAKVPARFNSESFAVHLLENAGISATPGNGFGEAGEGFIRFALTTGVERMKEAVDRMRKII